MHPGHYEPIFEIDAVLPEYRYSHYIYIYKGETVVRPFLHILLPLKIVFILNQGPPAVLTSAAYPAMSPCTQPDNIWTSPCNLVACNLTIINQCSRVTLRYPNIGIHIIKIKWSWDHFIFIMWIPIFVRPFYLYNVNSYIWETILSYVNSNIRVTILSL